MVYDIFFVALTSIDIYTLQAQVFFDAVQTLRIRSLTAKIFSSTVGDASKHRIERPWDIDPIRPGGLVQGGPLPVITGAIYNSSKLWLFHPSYLFIVRPFIGAK